MFNFISTKSNAKYSIMKLSFKNFLISSLMLTVTVLVTTVSSQAQETTPPNAEGKSVFEVVNSIDETSDFANLLDKSGYAQILKKQGPFTVLVPSNDAIKASDTSMEKLNENPAQLKSVVQGHLYQGEVPAEKVESQMGVTVQDKDESASNGVVYVIDQIAKQ